MYIHNIFTYLERLVPLEKETLFKANAVKDVV